MEARISAILEYATIVDRRRIEPATEADGYAELHHALPRSLGGSDDPENIVRLPVREHVMAHIALARAIGDQNFGRGMANAATLMLSGQRGEMLTIEQAAEARELMARSRRGAGHPMFGLRHTAEAREKMSAANRGKVLTSCHREKIAAAHRGKIKSDEARSKIIGEGNPNYKSDKILFMHISTGDTFELTRTEARSQLGLSKDDVHAIVSGRNKSAKGYSIVRTPA